MAEFPAPKDGIVLTHFIVSNDVERSSHFYTDVLGGELVWEGEPSIVALANGWVIINVGGGPTDDKHACPVHSALEWAWSCSSRRDAVRAPRPSSCSA